MPDDRFFHPRLRGSAKVSALTYFERCVWEDMVLGADDFGVLPYRPAKLRADNDRFAQHETDESIQAAMDHVISVGLFLEFAHQSQHFVCDPVWQDFQKVTYPRRTYYPAPIPEILSKCSLKTRQLFRKHSKPLGGDGHRLRLTAKARANGSGGGVGEPTPLAILFQIPESVKSALDRSPRLGAYPRLRDPRWWQAHVKANPGVDFAHQVLKAESWLVSNPDKPRTKLAVFLHHWLGKAERPADA